MLQCAACEGYPPQLTEYQRKRGIPVGCVSCKRRRRPMRDLEGTEVPVLIHQPIQCAVCKEYPPELQKERDMPAGDRILICKKCRPGLLDIVTKSRQDMSAPQDAQCTACKQYPPELRGLRATSDRILICDTCKTKRAAMMRAMVVRDTDNVLLHEHSGRQMIVKTYGETTDILAQLLIKMISNGNVPDVLSREHPDGENPVIRMQWLGTDKVRDYGYTARRYDLCMDIFNQYWNTAKFVGQLTDGGPWT